MAPIQIGFLIFTFLAPLVLWVLSRHLESVRFAREICRAFAGALVAAYAGTFVALIRDGAFVPRYALPMQLCDWALVATVIALTLRRQTCFELAYFWGLAGTVQALITPAVDVTTACRVSSSAFTADFTSREDQSPFSFAPSSLSESSTARENSFVT